jgi:hypothetical protein
MLLSKKMKNEHTDEKNRCSIRNGKINNIYYPHFVVYFNGEQAKISLDRKMTEGKLPPKETHEIMDWARRNYDLLETGWVNMMNQVHIK